MSFYEVRFPLLTLSPRLWGDEDYVHCRTHLLISAATLFAYSRTVSVDRKKRVVAIHRRTWWGLRRVRREIPFSRIDHIEYDFDDYPINGSWFVITDQVDRFTVSLALREPQEQVALASFWGDGAVMTGLNGVLLGDSIFDLVGDQANVSLAFVRALQGLLRVPLGTPVPHGVDRNGARYRCAACGRNSPPTRQKCQYCGGAVAALPS